MFIGHYGLALAAKRVEKNISMGLYFLAVQFVDIVWCVLVLLGIEKVNIAPGITAANPLEFVSYPFTHSLLGSIIWAGAIYILCRTIPMKGNLNRKKVSLFFGGLVLSHFMLDVVVHDPDLSLYGSDSPRVGLGLWNHVAVSYILESLIFLGGLYIYLKVTRGTTFAGKFGMIIFAAFLLSANAINLMGPPPPNVEMLAVSGLSMFLLFAGIAFWLDRKRI